MSKRFADRHVIVTGGSTGIGLATAKAFAEEGAEVTIVARGEERLERARAEIAETGSKVAAAAADVSDADAVEQLFDQAVAEFGPVDVLINNAGTVTLAGCADMTEAEWDEVMDVNVKGAFLCTRAALRRIGSDDPNIVNVSSQAGKRGYPRLSHYCASKAAMLGLTRSLAVELAPAIRINAVCPGIVTTEMMEREYGWEQEFSGAPREEIKARFLSSIPLGRFQLPEDVARAVLFLSSTDAGEITGAALNVTGGDVTD